MALWRQIVHGLRGLLDREGKGRDIAEEVRHYLEEAEADLRSEGLSAKEARREARRRYGRASAVRDEVRSYGWENAVGTFLDDLRYALRRLRKSPGFAVVSILTLALGIGASTAIFSVVKPILLDPLPYPDSDRILAISDRASDGAPLAVAFGSYRELAERSRSFEALAVARPWGPTLTGAGEPERLEAEHVSAAYFRVLGVAPVAGRAFDPSEDRAGGPNVVVLADALSRSRFGAGRAAIGERITLDGEPYTVIGIMPPGFRDAAAPSTQLWAPLQYDASLPTFEGREWGHHLRMVGRLRPGTTPEEARRELEGIAGDPLAEFVRPPWASLANGFVIDRLRDRVTRSARPTLLAVLGAVTLLLLIACVNVAHLLLARGARRRGELATRAALGARRGRIVRQWLTETLLLAALGGTLGVGLAVLGVEALAALGPPDLPRAAAIGMDGSALLVALGITIVAGLVIGVIPALRHSRGDLHAVLRAASGRGGGGRRLGRSALVVAEVSLTAALLVGAGLLLRSVDRLLGVDPGFRPAGTLALEVQTSGPRFADDEATRRFFADALRAVRAVPGVSSAALTSQLPLSGQSDAYGVRAVDAGPGGPDEDLSPFRYAVSPGYFETMGIPIRRGRSFEERRSREPPSTAVISESLATRLFHGEDPLGRRIQVGREDLPPHTVIGVAGDVRQASLSAGALEAVYVTPESWYFADRAMWFVVRAEGSATPPVPAVEAAIWSVDDDQPVVRVSTVEGLVRASSADRRFALTLFQVFAIIAVVLAAIGLYGVLSGSVNERSREMAVRAALGAGRDDLLGLVIRQGLRLTGLGVLIGLIAALVISSGLRTLLYGVSRLDPITYLGVIVLLVGVGSLACAAPAWRAARVDPAAVLRSE